MSWLRWSIHEGFFSYVESVPDCTIELTGGVTRTADGEFSFPAASALQSALDTEGPHSSARKPGNLHFAGKVAVHAYEGLLRVELTNPVIEFDAEGGQLFTENPHRPEDLVAVARFGAPRERRGYAVANAELTSQGAGWLSEGRYAAGTKVSPVKWIPWGNS